MQRPGYLNNNRSMRPRNSFGQATSSFNPPVGWIPPPGWVPPPGVIYTGSIAPDGSPTTIYATTAPTGSPSLPANPIVITGPRTPGGVPPIPEEVPSRTPATPATILNKLITNVQTQGRNIPGADFSTLVPFLGPYSNSSINTVVGPEFYSNRAQSSYPVYSNSRSQQIYASEANPSIFEAIRNWFSPRPHTPPKPTKWCCKPAKGQQDMDPPASTYTDKPGCTGAGFHWALQCR